MALTIVPPPAEAPSSRTTLDGTVPDVKINGTLIMFDDLVERAASIVSDRLYHFLAGSGANQ